MKKGPKRNVNSIDDIYPEIKVKFIVPMLYATMPSSLHYYGSEESVSDEDFNKIDIDNPIYESNSRQIFYLKDIFANNEYPESVDFIFKVKGTDRSVVVICDRECVDYIISRYLGSKKGPRVGMVGVRYDLMHRTVRLATTSQTIENTRRDYPVYQIGADYKTPIRSVENEYTYGSMLRSQIQ